MNVHAPVLCELAGGELFAGMIVNVGLGGCKVECDRALDSGAQVEMSTRLPGSSRPSQAVGVVRWSQDGTFGARVSLLDANESAVVAKLATEPMSTVGQE
jgi:hypothetical protein